MITAGIDVGLESTKIVVLKDGQVAGSGLVASGGGKRKAAVEGLWQEVLQQAKLSADDVDAVVATGQGKYDVTFAGFTVVEPVADARVGRYVQENATSVVDMGADQIRLVTLGEGSAIEEVVLNQKCAAGLGTLLKTMARRLEMSQEAFSGATVKEGGAVVNDGCGVFAELDALSMLNRGAAKEEVAAALNEMAGIRISAVLNDKIHPQKDSTVLVGGLTKNKALVEYLKARSGLDFIIPDEAEYATALGAALIAAEPAAG